MELKEYEILDFIRNWGYNEEKVEKLKEDIARIMPSVTARYSFSGGKGGETQSKVEVYIEKKTEYARKLRILQTRFQQFNTAKANAGLSEQEDEILILSKNGWSLRRYAADTGIYKSTVYKIRDRAVRKIAKNVDWEAWGSFGNSF